MDFTADRYPIVGEIRECWIVALSSLELPSEVTEGHLEGPTQNIQRPVGRLPPT